MHHTPEAWDEQAPVHTLAQKDTPKQAAAAGSPATHLLLVLVLLCCAHPGLRPRAAAVPSPCLGSAFAACMRMPRCMAAVCCSEQSQPRATSVCVIRRCPAHTPITCGRCWVARAVGCTLPQPAEWLAVVKGCPACGRAAAATAAGQQLQTSTTFVDRLFRTRAPALLPMAVMVSVVLASRLTGRSCRSASCMQTGFCCHVVCALLASSWEPSCTQHQLQGGGDADSVWGCRATTTPTHSGCVCVLGLAGE